MKKRIFDTGRHLPQPGMGDWFELQNKREKLVVKPILRQSKRDGTVLYGQQAVNRLLPPSYRRSTYDYDVYSKHPLRHAKQIERSIDCGTNSNLAFVEQTTYPSGKTMRPLWRVKIHGNDTVEADYNIMPKGIHVVKKDGIHLESLRDAKSKYKNMIRQPSMGRGFQGVIGLGSIEMYENNLKKNKGR